MLNGLPSKGSLGQVCLSDSGFGHRLLAVGCANPIECPMRRAHIPPRLMTWQCFLLRVSAHGVSEKLHLFDCALQLRFAESKTNELEDQHQVQRWRRRLDALSMNGRTLEVKRELE